VRAKKKPTFFFILGKKKLIPTSVKKPIYASGIANNEFSVAILITE
jgi:hypothetical protein